ncbi:MAG TPA: hypothetical protein VMN57_01960 [Anaerolineales bacterium]|nr:hypothetical protein [Anaerolineales bacterium]
MTLPAIVFGVVLSTFFGVVFHLWRGGGLRKLAILIVLAWGGFWIGQVAGAALDLTLGRVGTLLLGTATAGSFFVLVIGNWIFNQPEK